MGKREMSFEETRRSHLDGNLSKNNISKGKWDLAPMGPKIQLAGQMHISIPLDQNSGMGWDENVSEVGGPFVAW